MKFKASKKQMKEEFYNIVSVGYCDLQTLLKYANPIAYSAGNDGWACDYYALDGVLVSTGYSPIGTKISYERIKDYENRAMLIDTREDMQVLVDEFSKEFSIN